MPGAQSPGGADTEHSHPRRKATSTAPALTQRSRLGTSGVLWPRQGFRFYLSTFAKLGCVPWSTFLKKWNPSPCPFSEFLSPHPPPPPFLPPYVLYYFRQSSGATEEFQCMSGSSFSTPSHFTQTCGADGRSLQPWEGRPHGHSTHPSSPES